MVEISTAAAREINRIKASQKRPDSHLRIKITSGGCSGLFYHLTLESSRLKSSNQGDQLYHSQGISILIDSQSDQYIQKLKLDYSEDLMGGGFRFQNPEATNTCGCGLSFAAKH
ncbi:MAG: HesB/IscA family protein [Pleurocapsa sp.]